MKNKLIIKILLLIMWISSLIGVEYIAYKAHETSGMVIFFIFWIMFLILYKDIQRLKIK